MNTVVTVMSGAAILGAATMLGALFLRVWREPQRLERYEGNLMGLGAICILVAVLSQTLLTPLRLLVIPIFLLGALYATYDAFVRTMD